MIRSIQERQLSVKLCRDLLRREELRSTYSLDFSHLKQLRSIHQKSVLSLDFDSSDERFLLSGGLDGIVCVYDLQKTVRVGEELAFKPVITIKRSTHIQAHRSGVTSVAWNPQDTSLFVTGGFDKKMCVWDTNEVVMVHAFRFDSDVKAVKISPVHPQSLVAVGSGEREVSLCDLRLGETAQVLSGHTASVTALAWSPGNEYCLVSGASDGAMLMWDLRKSNSNVSFDYGRSVNNSKKRGRGTGENLNISPNGRLNNPSAVTRPEAAHIGAITDIAFLPCGTQILSTGLDHMMRLWGVHDQLNQAVHYPNIRNHAVHMAKICLSNNGSIVYHPKNNEITALEVQTGKQIHSLHGHYSAVTALAFHSAMPELYSASSDGLMHIWTPYFTEDRFVETGPIQNAVLNARRNAIQDHEEEDQVADWNSDEELF